MSARLTPDDPCVTFTDLTISTDLQLLVLIPGVAQMLGLLERHVGPETKPPSSRFIDSDSHISRLIPKHNQNMKVRQCLTYTLNIKKNQMSSDVDLVVAFLIYKIIHLGVQHESNTFICRKQSSV